MKPQEIDRIANVIVGSLAAGPETGLLGCGSYSSTSEFTPYCPASNPFECGAQGYACGIQGLFTCAQVFSCEPTEGNVFGCDDGSGFLCGIDGFNCEGLFHHRPILLP